jgi:hypothetical protein
MLGTGTGEPIDRSFDLLERKKDGKEKEFERFWE